MPLLDEAQRIRAIEVMHEYLNAPPNPNGKLPKEEGADLDQKREALIESELKPMLQEYFEGRIDLAGFKSTIDGINKRHELWGFKGIKGQMFYNMVVNVAGDLDECNEEIKAAIAIPISEEIAASRIKTFLSYVKRIGEEHVDAAGSKHGRPKIGSIPYFLSYFWQLQDREKWPVYYTNAVNTMTDLNIWQQGEELAANYISFKRLHDELVGLFSKASGSRFTLYDVEHVFWYKGGNPYSEATPATKTPVEPSLELVVEPEVVAPKTGRLPESFVPPIVGILPAMARHDSTLVEAAKKSGTSLERAFEKNINSAFTMLGYETKLLGQGQGRVPDGRAIDRDNSYAIIWDAKIRGKGYSMGTDDRVIRDYITTQSRELKRSHLRNIYYAVVSSGFADDYEEVIRSLKMETDIGEVCLLHADALVAMVDAKLRDPKEITLGPDGIQRLFSTSGSVTSDIVRNMLG